jgi:hypothetical protein
MMCKLDNYGIPEVRSMEIIKDPNKVRQPARVKDHDAWRNEAKPWGDPPYPGKASDHPSVELHYLYRTALRCGGNVANLGTFRGISTMALAHGLKEHGSGRVYAIDYYDRNTCFDVEKLTTIFEERGLIDQVQFCKGHTQDWARKLSSARFNFIFIDADHQYESTKQDFQFWSPLLAKDGEIAFHDVNLNTVERVIEELEGWELVDFVHNIKTFRRAS